MIDSMPDGGSVVLPVDALREWLDDSAPGVEPDLTVDEVAEFFGRSPVTIRTWIRSGELRAYKFNNREYRIPRAALQELMDRARSVLQSSDPGVL